MRLEVELDPRHVCRVGTRLPAEHKPARRLDDLDYATIRATWSCAAVPGKDDLSARSEIDRRLCAEPGAELLFSSQRRPDTARGRRQDELAFYGIRDVRVDLARH